MTTQTAISWHTVREDSGYVRYVGEYRGYMLEQWSYNLINGDYGWYWRVNHRYLLIPAVGFSATRKDAIDESIAFVDAHLKGTD